MKAIGTVGIFAALTAGIVLCSSACALPAKGYYSASEGAGAATSKINFRESTFGPPARLDRMDAQTAAVAESYYDFDTIITLGTLVIAGGALAAVGFSASRRKVDERDRDTQGLELDRRDVVMRTLEADLTHYARGIRHVA